MKIANFAVMGGARLGVVDGDTLIDLTIAAPDLPKDLIGLIGLGQAGFDAAKRAAASALAGAKQPLNGAKLLQPHQNPGKIVCLGLNYAAHAAEGGHQKPDYPSFFLRCTSSLLAHGEPVIRPKVSDKLDFEAELAFIVGKRSRHLTMANALTAVAGYTVFNDVSVRDYQRKTGQWTIGKNFDATGPVGPWFVPAADLPPGAVGLKIESRLNGEVMQSDNTKNMIFPVAETIVILSECLTLEPGDLIVMGTPSGVGYARKPPVFMKPGDMIDIEIEGIGVLSNPIAAER